MFKVFSTGWKMMWKIIFFQLRSSFKFSVDDPTNIDNLENFEVPALKCYIKVLEALKFSFLMRGYLEILSKLIS